MLWLITTNSNPRVLKIEKCKIIKMKMKRKNKIKWSPLFHILIVYEISANKTVIVTDNLISQLFVVAFVYPVYVQIAQYRAICTYTGYTKATTNNWDIKLSVTITVLLADIS